MSPGSLRPRGGSAADDRRLRRRRWRDARVALRLQAGASVLAATLAAAGCERSALPPAAPSGALLAPGDVYPPFLREHWRELPLPLQGPAPPGFTPIEASLHPRDCGACHPQQYQDWRTSLHAQAYSPGLAGQLVEGALAAPAEVRSCLRCHAPLGEQQPFDAAGAPEPAFDADLRAQGIACASCHVRAHQRYGPPRRGPAPPPETALPHGGFEARTEFQESAFCAPCHQFFDDAGVAGKPLENTWAEWAASEHARAGRTCQSCHMPDRRHLWRGIHDPETVRAAVPVELERLAGAPGRVQAALRIRSAGVGHAFPAYTTPRVFAAVWQADAAGAELPGTRRETVIAREIDFSTEPWSERLDTRLLPGETALLPYDEPAAAGAARLVARVTVDPDFHYRGVFQALLADLEGDEARAAIEEAARRVADSAYVLAERELALESVVSGR